LHKTIVIKTVINNGALINNCFSLHQFFKNIQFKLDSFLSNCLVVKPTHIWMLFGTKLLH